MEDDKLRIGISQGDINGIGYEVILKTLAEQDVYGNNAVVLYGSSKVAAYHKKVLGLNRLNFTSVNSASDALYGRLSMINCNKEDVKVDLGQETSIAGEASYQALSRAVTDLKDGFIDVLVTAPINKNNIQSDSFKFPGHTEYIEKMAGHGEKALMIMAGEILRVAVVTGHIPVSEIASTLTEDLIMEKLKIFNKSLLEDFSIRKPKIAVLGLNPHAGDKGVIGNEDVDVIAKVVKQAQEQNICCFGPIPADGFFGSGDFKKYDGILAMYHDQGLIPFKILSMDRGVNYTAGLPVIRTSPAHGTAYSLAGRNIASPDSFREALYMACDIYKNRKIYKEISANPLSKQHVIRSNGPDVTVTIPEEEENDI